MTREPLAFVSGAGVSNSTWYGAVEAVPRSSIVSRTKTYTVVGIDIVREAEKGGVSRAAAVLWIDASPSFNLCVPYTVRLLLYRRTLRVEYLEGGGREEVRKIYTKGSFCVNTGTAQAGVSWLSIWQDVVHHRGIQSRPCCRDVVTGRFEILVGSTCSARSAVSFAPTGRGANATACDTPWTSALISMHAACRIMPLE